MTEKILFVDDEENVLNAFRRQLRKGYDVTTESRATDALQTIEKEGPFAVIVSDMRMPEMDGIEFLKASQELAPDSVRLMLTGNADQQTAIDAVNEGKVFRFLNKPCDLGTMTSTIDAALEQYRLITAEKELLNCTLNGAIKLLTDILSLAAPSLSAGNLAMRKTATEIARALRIESIWEMEMATMLSHVGHVTLPADTVSKMESGESLSDTEKRIVSHLPETAYKLLVNIPRLKNVARIVLYKNKNFDGSGFPADTVAGEDIPLESRVLKVLHDAKVVEKNKGVPVSEALEMMKAYTRRYDPRVLQTVTWFFSEGDDETSMSSPTDVTVGQLRPGQLLVSNVETEEGRLLFTAGQLLNEAIVGRLMNYHEVHKIKEPISVSSPIGG